MSQTKRETWTIEPADDVKKKVRTEIQRRKRGGVPRARRTRTFLINESLRKLLRRKKARLAR